MNRNAVINIALGVVILILLGVLVVMLRGGVNPAQTGPINVSTSTIQADTSVYTVKADYPVFGIPALDSQIKQAVGVGVADIEGMPANPSPNNIKNEFISSFDSVYTDAHIASARLILSEYTGGAHDISAAVGFTYDRDTKSLLTLDDALALTGDSLAQISAIAQAQLTKQFGSVQFPDGLAPTAQNFGSFTINKDSVIFTIQEYQAEPFSDGMPQVVVPRVK